MDHVPSTQFESEQEALHFEASYLLSTHAVALIAWTPKTMAGAKRSLKGKYRRFKGEFSLKGAGIKILAF